MFIPKPEILFLKQEDVVAAGLLDMKMILEVTEKTFKMIGEGQVINPPKTMLGMPDLENWTSFCMSMPSYIGGDIDIAGFKWMIETSDYVAPEATIGLFIEPDAIHVMKKSEYSGRFGDYSTFSDEMEHLSDPDPDSEEDEDEEKEPVTT